MNDRNQSSADGLRLTAASIPVPHDKEKAQMRSIKLTAGVAAVASLALFCAAASAAPGHRRPHLPAEAPPTHVHGCRLSFEFKQRVIAVGESAAAAGALTCAGEPEPGVQTVTLYGRSLTSPAWAVVTTGSTEKNGSYSIPVSGLTHNTEFYAVSHNVRSPRRAERVLAEVKVSGPTEGVQPTTLKTGHPNEVTFTGSVSPEDENSLVVLQRQDSAKGEEWHRIGKPALVGKGGAFTIKHVFEVPGPANIRVVLHAPGLNVASPSNTLSYEIEQRQNPSLVINTSADPISAGQTFTISGKVGTSGEKVPMGTPVKLFARAAHHFGFSQVTETKTSDEAGDYTFASQAPMEGTFYKAEALGKHSAQLYEGVKYVLTASISPGTTLEEGKPVTFSGTVKPGVAGHKVYLERENAAHTAFHVIETGEVVAPEPPTKPEFTFKIEYRFYVTGTTKVRIKVPGDPQNGSTVSETFTLQVNPASASTLVGSPPLNPKLPSEGQI
jgi:hypothetical protein